MKQNEILKMMLKRYKQLFSSFSFLILLALYALLILSLELISVDQTSFESLDFSRETFWAVFSLSLGAGVCAMTVVQCWKSFLRPRASFHGRSLSQLFGEHYVEFMELAAPGFALRSYPLWFNPWFSKHSEFLDSPVEILMSRISATAEYALMNPEKYLAICSILTGMSDDELIAAIEQDKKEERAGQINEKAQQLLENNLQLLHVQLHEKWKYRVKGAAVLMSAILGSAVCLIVNANAATTLLCTVSAGLFGGVFSWLSRDVVAAIEGLRR